MKLKNGRSFIITLALVGVVCYFVIMIVSLRMDIREKSEEATSLRNQVTQQDAENEDVKNALEEENESEYMERIAREELDLIMPDERVYADSAQ